MFDIDKLSTLSPQQQKEVLEIVARYESAKRRENCSDDFIAFVKEMWAAFIEGYHHKIMSDAFNDVKNGKLKRLIINMPLDIQNQSLLLIYYPLGF